LKTLLFFLSFCSFLCGSERHIALIIKPAFKGEVSFAYRIQEACKNLGWLADVIDVKNPEKLKENKYDFVISMVPNLYEHPKCKNYLIIFDPEHHFFDRKGRLQKRYYSFDGYLLGFPPDLCARKEFDDPIQFPNIQWYPSAQRRDYQTVNPASLFHVCCSWGDRSENQNFRQLLSLLDKDPFTRLYGSADFKPLYPQSYQGPIPYDSHSLLEAAAVAGVSLILHSSTHNKYGLPSGRIFEMAAASTVIISDQNAFVRTHFGDSVLYINTDTDGASIHKQIQEHIDWIRANQTQALAMAKKAHEIYLEKFTLEDQLLRLEEFHNQLPDKPIHFWERLRNFLKILHN
jgi:hypothetical protein